MNPESADRKLKRAIDRQVARKQRASNDRSPVFVYATCIGTLGLLFVLPVVALAYLGTWLDGLSDTYSSRWTVGLILLGLCLGALNVYLYLRERPCL